MRHLFDRPLGACAPCGYLFKCDPYTLIAAGLNTAGSIMNNQINAERAVSDMATYLNLVKKQRDWQNEDKQWSEDYTKRLMDFQNQYNSPSEQMKRYREAGLNPYLAMQGGQIGSGNSSSVPQVNPGTRVSVSPFERAPLNDVFVGSADKLIQVSSLKSQRIAAESEFAKSLPDLVKGLGVDGAKRVASSVFGRDIDMQRIDNMIQNEYLQQSYDTKIKEIEANIKVLYGEKEAANVVALQEQSFNKMAAEIGLMASEGNLNDAKIDELSSQIARNMAESFKLKKEGDMFVASAAQLKAMTDLIGLQSTRLKFQNKSQGYVDGSPLWNLFGTKQYNKDVVDAYELKMDRAASKVEYFLNKWLGEYVKVSASGSVTPSVGNTYNYGY